VFYKSHNYIIETSIEYEIIEQFRDQSENILALHCNFDGTEILLISVYGPNTTDRVFYRTLHDILISKRNVNVVIGGDWNTTYCNTDPPHNIDCLNMLRAPNKQNGALLRSLCHDFDLIDPFRILHPEKMQYSYSPFGTVRSNKSRIDFFVISSNMLRTVNQCRILEYKLGRGFDHFPIFLNFGVQNGMEKAKKLTNLFLDDELLQNSVTLSALQVYSAALCPETHQEIRVQLRDIINRLTANVKECCNFRKIIAAGDESLENNILLKRLYADFYNVLSTAPNFAFLGNCSLNCDDKTFFTALTAGPHFRKNR
jgi:exonuclease III